MIRLIRIVICYFTISIIFLTACNTSNTRIASGHNFAKQNQFKKRVYETSLFSIVSFTRISKISNQVSIYIEGDGKAWLTKKRVSNNPTPQEPIALQLAAEDDSANVIYLARPCQFVVIDNEVNCLSEFWTNKRASREVINTYHEVLDKIKKSSSIDNFRLIGYSGGGTIAAILAAERKDIIDLRTIAGNLDIALFSKIHHVSPLTGSINPINLTDKLSMVPQLHFYSVDDSIVKPEIIEHYKKVNEQNNKLHSCVLIQQVNGTTHTKGWTKRWKELIRRQPKCSNK